MSLASNIRVPLAACIAASVAALAHAGGSSSWLYLPCESTEGIGSFSALVTYNWSGGSTATVAIDLTNDTAASHGGFITALALNAAPGSSGMQFTSSSSAAWQGLAGPVSGPPYGNFMCGSSITNSWLGGGSPNAGIGIGSMVSFVFTLSGSSAYLSGLDAQDVLDSTGYAMAVRFRGGTNPEGWSDKVIGCPVPAPGALALLAVAGMGSRRRRR